MIDLHCHSIFSDGELHPSELLKKAEELQLSYFSITDHNNCLAYEGLDIGEYSGVIIPGVEITTSFENHIIEIIGYGVDTGKINELYRKNKTDQSENVKFVYNKMIDICERNGIKYTKIKNIDKAIQGKPKQYFYNDLLKYEENKVKLGKKVLKSFADFNKKGLNNPKSILFLNESIKFPNIEEVAELIHRNNGLCFLAHVYQYNVENHIDFINKIKDTIKLDGVEVYHSSFSKEQISQLDKYAEENNLYKCGGSDYHGKLKPGIELGLGLQIPNEIIVPWINKIKVFR